MSSAKEFTRDKLRKMEASSSSPPNLDRDKDAESDDYGRSAARSSDASSFRTGGAVKGGNLGRPGRRTGGRVGRADGGKAYGPQQDPDYREWLGPTGGRGGRLTPFQKFSVGMWDKSSVDPRNWGGESPDPNEPNPQPPRDDPERARGGRIKRAQGGRLAGQNIRTQRTVSERAQDESPDNDGLTLADRPAADRAGRKGDGKLRRGDGKVSADVADNPGRNAFARGGRTKGKGKTVVNVIVGGGRDGQQQGAGPMPPMMPPPMPPAAPPPPPPRPPQVMPMPMGMPSGAAPMGAAGAPPPGAPPTLRARGGRIGSVAPATKLPAGAGGGKGRLAKAKHEGQRLPKVEPLHR